MSERKKQHYVPQYYLRNFSKDRKNLFCYNIKSGNEFFMSIKNACQENHFYGKESETDKLLTETEQTHAIIIKKIVEDNDITTLSPKEKYELYKFIILQIERTKDTKFVYNNMFDQTIENLIKPIMKSSPQFNKFPEEEIDKVKITFPSLHEIIINSSFINLPILFDLKPILIINKTGIGFVCSDSPVVRNNYIKLKNTIMVGLTAPGLQIVCPLSPKCILFYYDPVMYNLDLKNKLVVEIYKKSDLNSFNKLQILNCLENIFYPESSKKYIDELLKVAKVHKKNKKGKWRKFAERENPDGTFSKFVKYNVEEEYRMKYSFIKLNQKNYLKMKNNYNYHAKRSIIVKPVRNKAVAEEVEAKMKEIRKIE